MDIQNLNNLIIPRNQFNFDKKNILLYELINAEGYTIEQAKKVASSVCKVLTFWAEGSFKELIPQDFTEYFKLCIQNNWVRKEDCYINESYGITDGVFQHSFADKFNIKAKAFATYKEFLAYVDTQTEFVCTLRIISNSGGKHSLIAYKTNGVLYISDTSSRGIGKLFKDYITEKNFIYAVEMIG